MATQSFTILAGVLLLFLVANVVCSSNEITVYKFLPENRENNFIVIQPETPSTPTTGYSMCLRVQFWTWDTRIVFYTDNMFFGVYHYNYKSTIYYQSETYYDFPWDNMVVSSSIWNAVCLIYNNSAMSLDISINGGPMIRNTINDSIILDFSSSTILIGGPFTDYRCSGLVTDFNFWNKPLSVENVQAFMKGCFNDNQNDLPFPEYSDWSNAQITYIGNGTTTFSMPREYLCESSSSNTLIMFFESSTFEKSAAFCKRLNGNLLTENVTKAEKIFLKRQTMNISSDDCNKIWIETGKEGNQSNEDLGHSYGVSDKTKKCSTFSIVDGNFTSTNCDESLCFVCKFPEERLRFKLQNNWSNKFAIEKEYLLVNDGNQNTIFVGISGQTFIKGEGQWKIYNSKSISSFKMEEFATLNGTARFPFGIQSFLFKDDRTNETTSLQLKLSNVSSDLTFKCRRKS
jgi:hypothetical protein